jgi:alkylation response protein AidB-like acyl-CoA dehydrogenase
MATDAFTTTLNSRSVLGDRLAVDAYDEQELLPAILRDVKRFCAEYVDGERIDREGRIGPALIGELAAGGWFGLTVPTEFGGAGLSLAAATQVVSALAAHNGSVGTCIGLHSGLALHALLHLGTPALKSRYLSEVAGGQRIASFAATEPQAGSDISAVRTTLTEVDGVLRLNGAKCYVTNGGICGLLTVLARSPGLGGARAGHTLLLVDPESPGVSRGREEHKLGLKGSSTVTIEFENVEVPRDHVLGEPSKGLQLAHDALCWGRTFMAAGCLGSARAALRAAREHTLTRQQFGRPLARFPLVRQALAHAEADVYAIESALRLVCAIADTGCGDSALPSAIVKVLASEGAWSVVDSGLQLMGGAGYIEESGMARRLRDVRVTRIFEGANDVLRLSLASAAIAWPTAALQTAAVSEHTPAHLQTEARRFEHSFLEVGAALHSIKKQWGFKLFEQQAISVALADALIALFAALAVIERASLEHAPESRELATARLAIHLQLERAAQAAARALAPRDPALHALLDEVSGCAP